MGGSDMPEVFTRKPETVRESCAHRGLFILFEIVIFAALFYLTYYVVSRFYYKGILAVYPGIRQNEVGKMLAQLLFTVIPIVVFVSWSVLVQKRRLSGIGFRTKGLKPSREYGIGLLIGLLLMTIVIFVEAALGQIRFTGVGKPTDFLLVIVSFFAYMIQGMSEEVVSRGFFMVSVARRYPVWLAILANSLFFGCMHLLNPGMTLLSVANTCLVGILFSIIFLKRDSVWMVGGFHSAWNFAQSNIFGQSTSGLYLLPSVFKMTVPSGKNMISGGDYGVEASVVTTVLIIAAILIAIRMKALEIKQQAG